MKSIIEYQFLSSIFKLLIKFQLAFSSVLLSQERNSRSRVTARAKILVWNRASRSRNYLNLLELLIAAVTDSESFQMITT